MSGVEQRGVFIVPGQDDYDRAITSVDERVKEAGGVRPFIDHLGVKRRHSDNYYYFLQMSYNHVYNLLQEGESPLLTDEGMVKARTMLTGMVLAHVVNEELFPVIISTRVYERLTVPPVLFAPDATPRDIKTELATHDGQRRLYQVAANNAYTRVGDEGQEIVRTWTGDVGGDHPVLTALGVGVSLFMAYDHHVRKYANIAEINKASSPPNDELPRIEPLD